MVDQRATIRPGAAHPTAPITDVKPRCQECNRPLAWVATRPWSIKCGRCMKTTSSPAA